jgi:hypothetical protein
MKQLIVVLLLRMVLLEEVTQSEPLTVTRPRTQETLALPDVIGIIELEVAAFNLLTARRVDLMMLLPTLLEYTFGIFTQFIQTWRIVIGLLLVLTHFSKLSTVIFNNQLFISTMYFVGLLMINPTSCW